MDDDNFDINRIFPPILEHRQFTRDDVLAVTGLTAGQLKGLIDREQVRLNNNHNPGTGRRRLYTGGDILKIVSANVSNAIGFPLRWSYLLADQVERRATSQSIGVFEGDNRQFALALYPNKAGDDWAFTPVYDGKPVSALPIAFHYVDVSRLIQQTLEKLEALVAEIEMPSFDIPEPKHENPYSPETDFLLMWSKDTQGRLIRTGLTFEETQELVAFEDAFITGKRNLDEASNDRSDFLSDKHERARLKRVNDEAPQRARALMERLSRNDALSANPKEEEKK